MLGENHSVHQEFPEQHELIEQLMAEDMHFKRIADEYNMIDKEIRGIEMRDSPIDDSAFREMKKKRSHLKDNIYQMLLKHT